MTIGRAGNKPVPFWDRVDKIDGPVVDPQLGQCWMWMGAMNKYGYGNIKYNNRTVAAHRVSVELSGQDPSGMSVLHKCNNTLCVRPSHLLVGTQLDNLKQASRQGRMNRGVDRHSCKLTEADVLSIITEYAAGSITQLALAKRYKICQTQVSRILNKRKWKHVHPNA